MPSIRIRQSGIAITAALVMTFATACSSGSGHTSAKAKAGATTSTTHGAIGLLANADEKAEQVPDQPLDAATRQELADQLVVARQVAMKYPTVADALKGHLFLAGEFTPGAGAHYISIQAGVASTRGASFDATKPLSYIYDGTSPTSRVVGLMYGSYSIVPPEGFAGPNDHWHRHTNLCIVFGAGGIQVPFPPDTNVTQQQCDTKHGMFMRRTLWMVHAWVVPGWESPQGVFAHANVDLHCGDNTDHTDAVGFCAGSPT
jgi:hypothetical protein